MLCVENWAKEMNCDAVRLNSGMQRKEAHEFYKSLGLKTQKLKNDLLNSFSHRQIPACRADTSDKKLEILSI